MILPNPLPVIEICKYRHTRFWAVYADGELLAVTVYRKGAEAVRRMVLEARSVRDA